MVLAVTLATNQSEGNMLYHCLEQEKLIFLDFWQHLTLDIYLRQEVILSL